MLSFIMFYHYVRGKSILGHGTVTVDLRYPHFPIRFYFQMNMPIYKMFEIKKKKLYVQQMNFF